MAISEIKRNYVESLANEAWVDNVEFDYKDDIGLEFNDDITALMDKETHRICLESKDPEELHIFANAYNWDIGEVHMRQVSENPHCDAGTALMIYWRADPEYFLQYAGRSEVPNYSHETFDLLCEIERRYLAGEYKTKLCEYDPKSDVGCNNGMKEKNNRSIPKEMFVPIVSQ